YLANHTNTSTTAAQSEGQFIINGGTANINTDILDASTTVSGNGANVTTLTLAGGTLNLGGHNIGTVAAPMTNISLNSGTFNGAAKISGSTIVIQPTATINGTPTYLLPQDGLLNASFMTSGLTLVNGGGIEGGGNLLANITGDVIADTGSHI